MSYPSVRILQPPTPEMLDDKTSLYRFLSEIYTRTGGFKSSTNDLSGLTASVSELNTLEGVRLDESVQSQINSKPSASSLGTMAIQNSNNIFVSGGVVSDVNMSAISMSSSNLTSSNHNGGNISNCQITTPTGSSVVALSNGVINTNLVTTGSVAATETTLLSYLLASNTLAAIGSYIEIIGFGSFAANANNKQLKLK